ncbi:MAG: aldehyde dehydrogenase family protein, partial [Actinomycetota bacterium]
MHAYDKLFIGGKWVEPAGSTVLDVVSPHSEEVIGRVPEGTEADIDRAVEAARAAFDRGPWPQMTPGERIEILQRFAGIYASRLDDMAELITEEMGAPISFSKIGQSPPPLLILNAMLQVGSTFAWEDTRAGVFGGNVIVRREPVGVVGAIAPWNVPQFTAMSKLAPALVAGCTIVLKPAPETPLDTMLMAEMLVEAGVPEGVVSIVPAGREVGEHL